jgi:hypothetical protein
MLVVMLVVIVTVRGVFHVHYIGLAVDFSSDTAGH